MRKKSSYYSAGFPDLSTSKAGVAPVSDVIPANGLKKADKNIQVPEGFIVMNSHKQGDMIHPVRDLKYLGGKKQ